MLKLNLDYSDYVEMDDENFPEGKAINASTSESFDGTPLLADFMNDVNAAHIAMYEKAYGNRDGITGESDTQKSSQFVDAVTKYVDDKDTTHANKRGLVDSVHGATPEATAGQIVCRDEYGRAKFAPPLDDEHAIRKADLDALDTDEVGGEGKYLKTVSQTDGKITATSGEILSEIDETSNAPINSTALVTKLNEALTDYYNTVKNVVLYDNPTGIQNSTFTIVEDVDNFMYLMVFFKYQNQANYYTSEIVYIGKQSTPSTNLITMFDKYDCLNVIDKRTLKYGNVRTSSSLIKIIGVR